MAKIRSSVVDPREMLTAEEIDKKIEEVESSATLSEHSERRFNPVKLEIEELPKESEMAEAALSEAKIKKELPYDRARLEFLRITIGPVQNFYTTLGNILLSISERLAKVEARLYTAELKDKMQEEYALLVATEGRFVSMEEFKLHWEKLEKEKASESKKL